MAGVVLDLVNSKEEAIEEAANTWRDTVGALAGLKKRIRAEVEERFRAQIEAEVEEKLEAEVATRKAEAARAIVFAIGQGATKSALRQVTTKDHWDFESYVDLGRELARKEGR